MATPALSSINKSGLSELKHRILFLLLAILIFRAGSYIPVPGLDPAKLAKLFQHENSTMIGMFNTFSGGALKRFSIFALTLMPYISASIIIQLFSSIIPKLEQLKKDGESGQRKINQYTRYGTLILATFQAIGITKMLASQGIAVNPNFTFYFTAAVTLVTGTMFLMWIGEQITEKGVGNGISMIIFAGIVSGFPSAIHHSLQQFRENPIVLVLIIAVVVIVTAVVVFIERGQRKIKINYAQRQQGRKMFAAQTSHLPLKINMAGVIPPIFASSIIMFPASIAQWFGKGSGWLSNVGMLLQPGQPLYMLLFIIAIVFFCFFYTAVVFNPRETADNLKKSGAFIPGIRPGEQTAKYIDVVMSRLTMFGAVYLILICLVPQFLTQAWNVPFTFGGTSLLIVVVVVMDFMAQVQSHLLSQQYGSLMKKSNLKGRRATNS